MSVVKNASTVHIVDDRFWAKVYPKGNEFLSDCWLWSGSKDHHGYGQVRRGRLHYTHRATYAHVFGPIPDGLVLDHLCETPACCNPFHLQAVTQGENVQRASRHRALRCQRGHKQSWNGHQMVCKECKREYDARRYQDGRAV